MIATYFEFPINQQNISYLNVMELNDPYSRNVDESLHSNAKKKNTRSNAPP